MARFEQDLVDIKLDLVGHISLDWERVVEDPVFRQVTMIHGEVPLDEIHNTDPEWQKAVLTEYLLHYIIRDRLLRDTPSTNGPGELTLTNLEVVNGSQSQASDSHAAGSAVS